MPGRWLRRGLAGVGIFILAVGLWFYLMVNPIGGPGAAVVIHVTSGESDGQLGSKLASEGVISSSLAFHIDTSLFGSVPLSVGYYSIQQNSSFAHVKAVFAGAPNTSAITVTAGLTLYEIETQLANQNVSNSFLSGFAHALSTDESTSPLHPNGSMEGLVGVGTYVVTPTESPQQLAAAMTTAFLDQARRAGITAGQRLHGLSAYQLVVAASIVEKEGYYPINMPRVARVILNRLARGGGLQMDSTILYYFHEDGGLVTHAMLQTNTPYNTYLHPGLTPTPICVPSILAMHSMVDPPRGTWLYFTLVNKNGTMAFSTTFAKQLANERLAQERGLP